MKGKREETVVNRAELLSLFKKTRSDEKAPKRAPLGASSSQSSEDDEDDDDDDDDDETHELGQPVPTRLEVNKDAFPSIKRENDDKRDEESNDEEMSDDDVSDGLFESVSDKRRLMSMPEYQRELIIHERLESRNVQMQRQTLLAEAAKLPRLSGRDTTNASDRHQTAMPSKEGGEGEYRHDKQKDRGENSGCRITDRNKKNNAIQHIIETRRHRDEKQRQADRHREGDDMAEGVDTVSYTSDVGSDVDDSNSHGTDGQQDTTPGRRKAAHDDERDVDDVTEERHNKRTRKDESDKAAGFEDLKTEPHKDDKSHSGTVDPYPVHKSQGASTSRPSNVEEDDRLFLDERRDVAAPKGPERNEKRTKRMMEQITFDSMKAVWLSRKHLELVLEHPEGQLFATDAYIRLSDQPMLRSLTFPQTDDDQPSSIARIMKVITAGDGPHKRIKILVVDKTGDPRERLLEEVSAVCFDEDEFIQWKTEVTSSLLKGVTSHLPERLTHTRTDKLDSIADAITRKAAHLKQFQITSKVVQSILEKKSRVRSARELLEKKTEIESQLANLNDTMSYLPEGIAERERLTQKLNGITQELQASRAGPGGGVNASSSTGRSYTTALSGALNYGLDGKYRTVTERVRGAGISSYRDAYGSIKAAPGRQEELKGGDTRRECNPINMWDTSSQGSASVSGPKRRKGESEIQAEGDLSVGSNKLSVTSKAADSWTKASLKKGAASYPPREAELLELHPFEQKEHLRNLVSWLKECGAAEEIKRCCSRDVNLTEIEPQDTKPTSQLDGKLIPLSNLQNNVVTITQYLAATKVD